MCDVTHITTTRNVTYTIFKKVTTTVKQPAIVSVADLGCTERDYASFLNQQSVQQLLARCQWIIILLPGQEEHAPDWASEQRTGNESKDETQTGVETGTKKTLPYPKFQDLALDVKEIIETMRLDQVVLFGEGLAANLLARVAILDDIRVLGAVLLHCRGVFSGPLATVKDKMQQWRTRKLPTDAYTEKQFIDHRFGCINSDSVTETLKDALGKFKRRLHSDLNMQNLKCLSVAYEQRASLLEQLSGLSCPTLFIAGKNFLYVNGQRTLVEALKKPQQQNSNRRIESIEYEGTVNPMIEKPEKVAENLRLFLQGLGLVGSLTNVSVKSPIQPDGVITSAPPNGCQHRPFTTGATPGDPNLQTVGNINTSESRSVAPHVRRQLSMADLDQPRGPNALTSSATSTSTSTTGKPGSHTCHHVVCCRQCNLGHKRPP
ncbi:hypothetical protein AAHC03_01391 [Spirometra sp. Aus1]